MFKVLVLFCCVVSSVISGSPEINAFGAELFGKTSQHNTGSTAVYEKEAALYKRYLKILGAPVVRAEGVPSVREYLRDMAKFLFGGAVIGGVGFVTPIGIKFFSGESSLPLPDIVLTAAGMVATASLVSGFYWLNKLSLQKILPRVQAQKMKDFLYSWPAYRSEAPAFLTTLVEPYYAQLSIDGVIPLSDAHLSNIYTFLAALLNARLRDTRVEIKRITAGKKQTFFQKIKAIPW